MLPGAAGQASGAGAAGPILVVDDDGDQRRALSELLACAGYDVVVACDGQDAVEFLAGGLRPALIVLDLTMPRMDGWCFLEHLRRRARSTVPVLVTSAVARDRPPDGADACLEKPLDSAALRAAVARLLASGRGAPRG